MYKIAKPFFMICQTPMHVGSGNDLGIIDLPIQREKETGFPKIEASSLKGSIRESFEEKFGQDDENLNFAFGPINNNDSYASALGFTDARILLFPVKSMRGVYAYITCEKVLHRFLLDLNYAGIDNKFIIPQKNTVPIGSNLIIEGKGGSENVSLEEYTFKINKDDKCTELDKWLSKNIVPEGELFNYMREKVKRDIIVVDDSDFSDFVNLSTEVITRTKIDSNTGTVEDGALFTEEFLPAEAIMYSLALASPIFTDENKKPNIFKVEESKDKGKKEAQKVMDYFIKNLKEVIQIGGDATLGKGITRIKFFEQGV